MSRRWMGRPLRVERQIGACKVSNFHTARPYHEPVSIRDKNSVFILDLYTYRECNNTCINDGDFVCK